MTAINQNQPAITTIFYYTGTGNSLWSARYIAQKLGNTQVVPMTTNNISGYLASSSRIGLVFPVHIWGVPTRVLKFLDQLKPADDAYLFAAATNGGQVSNTLIQLAKELENRDLSLSAGWSVHLPSNYIPWGGPGPEEKQQKLFQQAQAKLDQVWPLISSKQKQAPEKGPLWQRLLLSFINKKATPSIPKSDVKFYADHKCNLCQVCINVCPANNIELQDQALVWKQQCEQCLACIQWCPQEALQYGKRTPKFSRYQHPDITLQDMIQ